MRIIQCIVLAMLIAPLEAGATSRSRSTSEETGVVCLDLNTGQPLWEAYAGIHSAQYIATDGVSLFLHGQYSATAPSRDYVSFPLVFKGAAPEPEYPPSPLPPPEILFAQRPTWSRSPEYVLSSGDRVIKAGRAIVILDGRTGDDKRIIPVGLPFYVLGVHQDLIICSRQAKPHQYGNSMIVAVAASSGNELWSMALKDGRLLGSRLGDRRAILLEPGGAVAIDLATGVVLWRTSLPRLRDHSYIVESDGRIFVAADCRPGDLKGVVLYCLDAASGELQWHFDSAFSRHGSALAVHGGKVYFPIPKSRLMWHWCSWNDHELLSDLSHLQTKEVGLILRAWHAYGDRAAVDLLRVVAKRTHDEEIRTLAEQLIESFPPVRDHMRLLDFLTSEFDREPELRREIGQVLRYCNPRPSWMGPKRFRASCMRFSHEVLFMNYELTATEQALIDRYAALQARTDHPDVTPLDHETLSQTVREDRGFSFEAMLEAHDSSDAEEMRKVARKAMFKNFPMRACDWALEHYDELDPRALGAWANDAPAEWLAEHPDLWLKWLSHESSSLQRTAAQRLSCIDDKTRVLPICEALLAQQLNVIGVGRYDGVVAAIYLLGAHGERRHAELIRPYYQNEQRRFEIRHNARAALVALGADDEKSLPRPRRQSPCDKPLDELRPYDRMLCLHASMMRALDQGKTESAKATAKEYLAAYLERGNPSSPGYLADAYEIVGDWDAAIEVWYTDDDPFQRGHDTRRIFPLLARAERYDELILRATEEEDDEVKVLVVYLLIDGKKDEAALQLADQVLARDRFNTHALIASAVIRKRKGELEVADALMDRAISLRPGPDPWFPEPLCHSISYWLDRGKPEKAIAWLRESVRIDRTYWEMDLFDWASEHAELAETVAELRLDSTDAP